jgi:hypothetical protein
MLKPVAEGFWRGLLSDIAKLVISQKESENLKKKHQRTYRKANWKDRRQKNVSYPERQQDQIFYVGRRYWTMEVLPVSILHCIPFTKKQKNKTQQQKILQLNILEMQLGYYCKEPK